MNFFQRRAKLKKCNYLELTPFRAVGEELDPSTYLVKILQPRFKNKWLVKYILPKSKLPHIKFRLDELGSVTWLAIDGKTKVADIIKTVQSRFTKEIPALDVNLTNFLSLLYRERMIDFIEVSKDCH